MKKIKKLTALLSAAVLAVPAVPAVLNTVGNPVTAAAIDDNNDDRQRSMAYRC